uniref:TOG domain-containing protein n=1 Tax=Echeneis naucrates TaxID=173247 RepID=A0A665W806_ECHNA
MFVEDFPRTFHPSPCDNDADDAAWRSLEQRVTMEALSLRLVFAILLPRCVSILVCCACVRACVRLDKHWSGSPSPTTHNEITNQRGGILLSSEDCACFTRFSNLTPSIKPSIMIPGLISQELHEQLLDPKNYQNRTNGVEELKHILSEVDIKSLPSDSIEDFINFLPRLLDDSNFKVLYSTLQVLNLLIEKLDMNTDKYFKQLVLVALKALGDTRAITRTEYMNVFRQLMKTVAPQQVLDLVICNLKHKNSRVREDVLNIIMAAMLTHPRKAFNIPKLCFEVAPCLADSKRKVRHATLELFAVFDYCLDKGKKEPLMKAVDVVELNEDAEGLMIAVQARRARHVLPKLSSEGMVEYGLVVPKPGQRSLSSSSGADLDWVMNGGRISSGRSHRTELDCGRFHSNGSLGSLTDDLPLQRRIVSAGKGKNKLPWEMSSFSSSHDQNDHWKISQSYACKTCLIYSCNVD